MRFYGKGKGKVGKKSLGDRMLEGAKKRRGTLRPKKRVWLGKVIVFAAAGGAVGQVLGVLIGKACGSPGIGMSAGCALGALAGAALGEGNPVEVLLGAILGGGLAFADYKYIQLGNVSFANVAKMSLLGPAGVFLGVVIGRALTRQTAEMGETAGKES